MQHRPSGRIGEDLIRMTFSIYELLLRRSISNCIFRCNRPGCEQNSEQTGVDALRHGVEEADVDGLRVLLAENCTARTFEGANGAERRRCDSRTRTRGGPDTKTFTECTTNREGITLSARPLMRQGSGTHSLSSMYDP